MQVRFRCPACAGTHVVDIPETTLHLTCSRTHKALRLRLPPNGDVKAHVVGSEGQEDDGGEE